MRKTRLVLMLAFILAACTPLQTKVAAPPTKILVPTLVPKLPSVPFSKDVLDSFGETYYYEEGVGLVYKNAEGSERLVMKLNDTQTSWVDDESSTEFPFDAYRPVLIDGVEPDGRPLKIIHTRIVGDSTEMYLPKTGEWRSIEGYDGGATDELDMMSWNSVDLDKDIKSGFLRQLALLRKYQWPANVIIPDYYVAFVGGSRNGQMVLSIYSNELREEYLSQIANGQASPLLAPVMYRIQSPVNDKWFPLGAFLQKGPHGEDLVFIAAFGSYYMGQYESGRGTFLNAEAQSLETVFLVHYDSYVCEDMGMWHFTANTIRDACDAFMPPNDPRWEWVGWETILNGAEFGSRYATEPLDTNFLAQYEDNVMIVSFQ